MIRARKDADLLDRYAVQLLPLSEIKPSPENDDIYGAVEDDGPMRDLVASIAHRGLEEPILLTADRYILSGHRRYRAVQRLEWTEVPVRIRHNIRREGNPQFHRELIEYNPQRVKKPGSLLREALLRNNNPADTYAAIEERRKAAMEVDAEFMEVDGSKNIGELSERSMEFLAAVQQVIDRLRSYWPLSIRQIHYQLLNNPPLRQTPKRSKCDPERWRYRNDSQSYDSLVRLLTSARFHGQVSMTCIDDPTRPQKVYTGFRSVEQFARQEVNGFLTGYHRHRQQDQERHIEVFAEKNTLAKIVGLACSQYYVNHNIGRGFCSIPVWRDIANRFRHSRCKRMTLIVVSDYDPEGLALADDAIRSLELFDVPVDGHRIAVTREQIEELNLADDYNPAKSESKHLNAFIKRTGGTRTWEVEALPPSYLIEQIKAAIEANMDMETFQAVCDQEREDCAELCRIREEIASQLDF